eukprot:303026_1
MKRQSRPRNISFTDKRQRSLQEIITASPRSSPQSVPGRIDSPIIPNDSSSPVTRPNPAAPHLSRIQTLKKSVKGFSFSLKREKDESPKLDSVDSLRADTVVANKSSRKPSTKTAELIYSIDSRSKSRFTNFRNDIRSVPRCHWFFPLAVFLIAQSLVLTMYFYSADQSLSAVVEDAQSVLHDYSQVIGQQFGHHLKVLHFVKSLLQTSVEVTYPDPFCIEGTDAVDNCTAFNTILHPDNFRTLAGQLIQSMGHGIQALEWIPVVSDSSRRDYERMGSKLYNGSREFHQGGSDSVRDDVRSEYYPVFYVEPVSGNERAILFNLGSNSVRLEALRKANETESQVASERITLVQETAKQSGFLVFDPIHLAGSLKGFALAVYRIGNTITKSMMHLPKTEVRLILFDQKDSEVAVGQTSSGQPVYGEWLHAMHASSGGSMWTIETEDMLNRPELSQERDKHPQIFMQLEIPVADRRWVLVGYALPEFFER